MFLSLSPRVKSRALTGVAVLFAFIMGAGAGAAFIAYRPAPTSAAAAAVTAAYRQAAARPAPVIVSTPAPSPVLSRVASVSVPVRRDLDCLTDAVYYEARGESVQGQAAVAQVVLNRARHPEYPRSVCGVVFQGARAGACQFSFVCDGAMRQPLEPTAWCRAHAIASRALSGYVMAAVGPAIRFHVTHVAWNGRDGAIARIGNHLFLGTGRIAPSVAPRRSVAIARLAPDKIIVALDRNAGDTPPAPSLAAD